MADTRGCRAKNPYDCRYHGALLRMETAQAVGDYDMYAEAKAEFDAEERKRKLFPFFYGETPVGKEPAKTLEDKPVNPHRFSGFFELRPREGEIGVYKRIEVTAPTREEVYDKLTAKAKEFADEMRASLPKSRKAELNRDLHFEMRAPALRGEKDTDNNGSSASGVSINSLTRWVHSMGNTEKTFFNDSVRSERRYNNSWDKADDVYFQDPFGKGSLSSGDLTEDEMLLPQHRMTGNLIPLRYEHEGDYHRRLVQARKAGLL